MSTPAPALPPRRSAFAALQEIGKALMLPVAVLPAAGLLLGFGSAFNDPSYTWHASIPHWLQFVGTLMVGASNAIFGNLPIIFALGVAIGLAAGARMTAPFQPRLARLLHQIAAVENLRVAEEARAGEAGT